MQIMVLSEMVNKGWKVFALSLLLILVGMLIPMTPHPSCGKITIMGQISFYGGIANGCEPLVGVDPVCNDDGVKNMQFGFPTALIRKSVNAE